MDRSQESFVLEKTTVILWSSGLMAWVTPEFNYTLVYKSDISNRHANALSWQPNHREAVENYNQNITVLSKILFINSSTSLSSSIYEKIQNESQKLAIDAIDNYEYYILEKVYKNKHNIIYVPSSLCTEILGLYHDSPTSGHPGHSCTTFTLHQHYWWPGATKDIKNYVDHCQVCTLMKGSSKSLVGKLIPLPIPTKLWTNISIDFITGLPFSNNFDSICTIADHFSKEVVLVPCIKQISSKDLAKLFMDHIWCVHGLPSTIVSNWGLQFTSKFTGDLCQLLGIKQKLSTASHPQIDRQTEYFNKEVEQDLHTYVAKQQENWAEWLKIAQFIYNNSLISATGTIIFSITKNFLPHMRFKGSSCTMGGQFTKEAGQVLKQPINAGDEIPMSQMKLLIKTCTMDV